MWAVGRYPRPPVPPGRLAALLALLASLLLPAAATAAGPEATQAALAGQMRLAGAASGALVVDVDTDRTLFAVRPDGPRIPASVQKLYTSAAALLRWGPDTQLPTLALGSRAPDTAGVLDGDLYLRGGGDPTLTSAGISQLAATLTAELGLVRVTGRVVGDESLFDARRGPPSSGFRTSQWVGPLSALTFNRGRAGGRFQSRPALSAAQALHAALKRRGVRLGARPAVGRTPATAVQLAQWLSPTMAELVRRTNVPSDNLLAESLIKGLGAEFGGTGSTSTGAGVVRATLAPLGLRPRVVDGSGLSRANRTSPRQVVRLLDRMAEDPAFPAFRASLAVAGQTGTLHGRMRRSAARGRCRAKTGTLHAVSALAGYCETGGRTVAFAFLMNQVSTFGARRLQDRMTGVLARYSPEGA
jgi:serine-type D-Ala-D-Ala carboxypeptidase/endopeptidase (penicillin-binding protein 4)